MSVEQTETSPSIYLGKERSWAIRRFIERKLIFRVATIIIALLLLFRSTPTPGTLYYGQFVLAVAGHGFNLFEWEVEAVAQKLAALVLQPVNEIPDAGWTEEVETYLRRAAQIGRLDADLTARASGLPPFNGALSDVEVARELTELRAQQDAIRPAVEQIIQQQVSDALVDEGFGVGNFPWPPVQFTFTEPPKKLVVSPRDRIATIYSRMLEPTIGLAEIEESEEKIKEQRNATAYITDIGGLGAYPSMVVDEASLRWVISTVAHEWMHNYLFFFPLGWNYFANQDVTTINESVSEIVGNEIGNKVLAQHYDMPPPSTSSSEQAEALPQPVGFSFQSAMRETRLEVDRLLALGEVREAEAYMEERRQLFLAEGYSLRVLNQAYFAFHGSYVTSPSSTSPIGPKLERLRELMPDLPTFVHTVRWFTSVDDLDAALAEWEARR